MLSYSLKYSNYYSVVSIITRNEKEMKYAYYVLLGMELYFDAIIAEVLLPLITVSLLNSMTGN